MTEETTKTEEIKIDLNWAKKVGSFLSARFNWIVYFLLGVIIWINIKIRTLPMKINPMTGKPGLWDLTRDNWTLGPDLDPFLFLRHAKIIVEQGSLSAIDTMRFVPLGHSTLLETQVLPYLIAYFYKFLNLFSKEVTVEYAAVVLPVVASVFMVIGFFLMVRNIFEWKGKKISNVIALIASTFLVTLPSLLMRTIAGIPEKESLGFGLMFFAFYFFIKAWKSHGKIKPLILGILAGASTALMALVWGGVIFVFAVIGIFGFAALLMGRIGKKETIVYLSWIVFSALLWLPFTLRTTFRQFFTGPTSGIAVAVGFMILVYFLFFGTRLKEAKFFREGVGSKIHPLIFTFVVSLLMIFLVGFLSIGPHALLDFVEGTVTRLFTPYIDRLSFTVAENAQPFFSTWVSNFGPIVGNVPLFFWLFFIGSIFLFKEMIKGLERGKSVFLVVYILSLSALIFSRTSPASILDGESFLSTVVYLSSFVIFIIGSIYIYHLNKGNKSFEKIKPEYILLFAMVFVGVIGARNGIRLIMLLASFAVIPLSYLAVQSVIMVKENKDSLLKLFMLVLTVTILMASSFTLYHNYKASEVTGANMIPNQYTHQWQSAMAWVRAVTPKDAVFGHWWDYGYWVQTMGERATMLDGGNSISYWNYLMGRHVLTADNESEALGLLWNHNITHFLIDSTEIGKYSAFSSIGSDENYDRFSWLGVLSQEGSQTKQTANETTLFYIGGPQLDEDIIIDETELFSGKRAGVGAIILRVDNEGKPKQPSAVLVYAGKEREVPLRYLFYEGNVEDFGSGIEAGVFVFPTLIQSARGIDVNPFGATVFLSKRNINALWIQLYLLEQGEQFKLVHVESHPLIKSLRAQGLNITSEFLYYGQILGPIKIWEVEYTGYEEYNEEYLQRTYPDRIAGRRLSTI